MTIREFTSTHNNRISQRSASSRIPSKNVIITYTFEIQSTFLKWTFNFNHDQCVI